MALATDTPWHWCIGSSKARPDDVAIKYRPARPMTQPNVSIQLHEVTIDCLDVDRVASFWAGVLGGHPHEPMPGWLRLRANTAGGSLTVNFQPVPEVKAGKARVHLDLLTDDLEAATTRVIQLGGRSTGERHDYDEGAVVVLTDPEGTELCLVEYRK